LKDKLHRNLVVAVVEALTEIFVENRYADKVIERTLAADPRRGSRDRAFIADTVYSIVRWWRLTGFYANVEGKSDVDSIWRRVSIWFQASGYKLPDWLQEYEVTEAILEKRIQMAAEKRAIHHSIPDWLEEFGSQFFSDEKWNTEMESLNERAELVIRVNTLKITRPKLKALLETHDIECLTSADFPDAMLLERKGNLFAMQEFKDGLFEVQDAGSQTIAPFLRVEPGMRVIDACAGAGGKTLHLASLMEGKGRIVSMDIEDFKLIELKRRARRNGIPNIETRLIEGAKTIKRLAESADRLLLDVPCSGLGVIRRNPDAKWKLNPEFIARVQETQAEILSTYPVMLKPGGLLVYATCSILPVENENQVQKFLAANPNFELIEEKHVWPSEGFDGFYMALIKKN
jgi:16S rRNA (cytosine967-C5)-methyltransferase